MHAGFDPQNLYNAWAASDQSLNDFMNQYNDDEWLFTSQQANQQQRVYDSDYNLGSREDWMRSRGMPVKEKPKPIPDSSARIREIEKELDIIRGRVPTPKGYRINPLRIKELMQEYKQLTNT